MCLSVLFVVLFCYSVKGDDFYVYHSFFYQYPTSSSILKVLNVQSQLSCAFSCSSLSRCSSFNFAHQKDFQGKYLCVLLITDMKTPKLESSEIFHYYEKVNPEPCSSHPCKNGGKCDVIAGARDFTCTCAAEFKGTFCELAKWTSINSSCFGARDDKYGSFTVQRSGVCDQVKLVRTSGHVTCNKGDPKGKSYWGCVNNGRHLFLTVVITDDANKVLLPGSDVILYPGTNAYNLADVNATSAEWVYPKKSNLFPVASGEIYRIWFGQDLDNNSEDDNDGEVCVNVFCLYQ